MIERLLVFRDLNEQIYFWKRVNYLLTLKIYMWCSKISNDMKLVSSLGCDSHDCLPWIWPYGSSVLSDASKMPCDWVYDEVVVIYWIGCHIEWLSSMRSTASPGKQCFWSVFVIFTCFRDLVLTFITNFAISDCTLGRLSWQGYRNKCITCRLSNTLLMMK